MLAAHTKSQRQIATPTLSIHLHGIEIALQKMSWKFLSCTV